MFLYHQILKGFKQPGVSSNCITALRSASPDPCRNLWVAVAVALAAAMVLTLSLQPLAATKIGYCIFLIHIPLRLAQMQNTELKFRPQMPSISEIIAVFPTTVHLQAMCIEEKVQNDVSLYFTACPVRQVSC